jgi:peptide deformylase
MTEIAKKEIVDLHVEIPDRDEGGIVFFDERMGVKGELGLIKGFLLFLAFFRGGGEMGKAVVIGRLGLGLFPAESLDFGAGREFFFEIVEFFGPRILFQGLLEAIEGFQCFFFHVSKILTPRRLACYNALRMLKIIKDTTASLRSKSKPLEMPLSKEDKDLLDEMLAYLKQSQDEAYREKHPACREGVGLAAPQVGKNLRMLVISYLEREDPTKTVEYELVNPRIIVNSVRKCYLEGGEGCLSVDEPHPGHVFRDYKIVVDAYNALSGKQEKITARGYDAVVLQHEIDHLDGILFYDRIDPNDPNKILPDSLPV